MGTATFVKQRNGTGDGRVYRLDPPMVAESGTAHQYVWVSAVDSFAHEPTHETYIFPSDAEGNVVDWCEQEGSFQGGCDHAKALAGAGYEVTP